MDRIYYDWTPNTVIASSASLRGVAGDDAANVEGSVGLRVAVVGVARALRGRSGRPAHTRYDAYAAIQQSHVRSVKIVSPLVGAALSAGSATVAPARRRRPAINERMNRGATSSGRTPSIAAGPAPIPLRADGHGVRPRNRHRQAAGRRGHGQQFCDGPRMLGNGEPSPRAPTDPKHRVNESRVALSPSATRIGPLRNLCRQCRSVACPDRSVQRHSR
jgi:hypothetical protein